MSLQFMPELSSNDRLRLLQENAAKTTDGIYQKPLTPEQLDANREKLSDNLIQLSQWEDELSAIKDEYKTKMKPSKEENALLLGEIKTKQKSIVGVLYHVPNFEEKMMEVYDEEGELIESRRLRPDEQQGRLFIAGKTANG